MNIDNKNNNIENEKKGYPIQNIEKNEIIAQSNLIPKNTKIDNSSRNPGINFKEIDYYYVEDEETINTGKSCTLFGYLYFLKKSLCIYYKYMDVVLGSKRNYSKLI